MSEEKLKEERLSSKEGAFDSYFKRFFTGKYHYKLLIFCLMISFLFIPSCSEWSSGNPIEYYYVGFPNEMFKINNAFEFSTQSINLLYFALFINLLMVIGLFFIFKILLKKAHISIKAGFVFFSTYVLLNFFASLTIFLFYLFINEGIASLLIINHTVIFYPIAFFLESFITEYQSFSFISKSSFLIMCVFYFVLGTIIFYFKKRR